MDISVWLDERHERGGAGRDGTGHGKMRQVQWNVVGWGMAGQTTRAGARRRDKRQHRPRGAGQNKQWARRDGTGRNSLVSEQGAAGVCKDQRQGADG